MTKQSPSRRTVAILEQKQYPSVPKAIGIRYWALALAEVFHCSFLFLSSFLVFQLGSGFGGMIFKFSNKAKPYL
jgi:hypothetical protein